MAFQFIPFVITPEELKNVLEPFSLFIGDTHVPIKYKYTPTREFIEIYSEMYDKLSRGERIEFQKHYSIMKNYFITTNIDSVIFGKEHEYEGKIYKMYIGTSRGYAPYLAPFSFSAREEYGSIIVSTRESYIIERASVMGFQLAFPKEIETMESHSDIIVFKKRLKDITAPLKFKLNSIYKKTNIFVSKEVKDILDRFYCINRREIEIL